MEIRGFGSNAKGSAGVQGNAIHLDKGKQYQGLVKGAMGHQKKNVGLSQDNGKGAKGKRVPFAEATQNQPSGYQTVTEVLGVHKLGNFVLAAQITGGRNV